WSPDGHWLTFLSTFTGIFEVNIIKASGFGARKHTDSGNPNMSPRWSRDGRIFYVEIHGDSRQLKWMNPDGSNQTFIAFNTTNSHWNPAISPDVQNVAFHMNPDKSTAQGIFLVDSRGQQNPIQLTDGEDYLPSWSPDGKWIYFHRRTSNNQRILFRIEPNGENLTEVLNTPSQLSDVEWQ
ncbi:MAG: hypothetical protein AAGD96_25020, partial [Chloroflexota bacterium]